MTPSGLPGLSVAVSFLGQKAISCSALGYKQDFVCVFPADSHRSMKKNQSPSAPHADGRWRWDITAMTIWVIERKLRRNFEVFHAEPINTVCTIHNKVCCHRCWCCCNILHILHRQTQPSTAAFSSSLVNKHLLYYSYYNLRYSHAILYGSGYCPAYMKAGRTGKIMFLPQT